MTIFAKLSISDVCRRPGYASGHYIWSIMPRSRSTLSWRRSLSYRNQFIDLQSKLIKRDILHKSLYQKQPSQSISQEKNIYTVAVLCLSYISKTKLLHMYFLMLLHKLWEHLFPEQLSMTASLHMLQSFLTKVSERLGLLKK